MTLNVQGVTPLMEVFDMPEAVAFYRDVLGFAVIQTYPSGNDFTWALLMLNDAALMLNTAYEELERPLAPEQGRVAGHGDMTLFFGCPDVDAAYQHLRAHGVDLDAPIVSHYGMKQIWLTDPDGFKLCFQSPVA
jgi:glyoxylase I family protein